MQTDACRIDPSDGIVEIMPLALTNQMTGIFR